MNKNELLLKTAFCCMACDGQIAESEVTLLKELTSNNPLFEGIDVSETLNAFVMQINSEGVVFISEFLNEIQCAVLNTEDSIELIKYAIQIIEADENVEYSEIQFFKQIRIRLNISDEEILKVLPDKEDYLLPDVLESTEPSWHSIMNNISFCGF